jgi:hypothetical protein
MRFSDSPEIIVKHRQNKRRQITAMQGDNGIRQRLRELAAKIATEQDHDKFTALVQEFNQLLDEEKQQPNETP